MEKSSEDRKGGWKAMKKKLVIIGAGSAMFTQGLVVDLMRSPKDVKWHLGLVDTDPKALDIISRLCCKMLDAWESDIELSYSTDRCEVLPGADYVVSTIGVGGRRAWEMDVFIPRKYGIFQPVGDTVMPGGISRAMRMIPAMVEIARDIAKHCPNAFFFNYANPMTVNCMAIRKVTGFPVVGLCHGVNHMEGYLADFAGLEREKVTSLAVGLNHLTFIYDFRYDGEDAWPMVQEKLQRVRKDPKSCESLAEPFAWELFEIYNAFAAPGDRHITEFLTEGFPGGRYYNKTLGVDAYSFEQTIESGDRIYDRMEQLAYDPGPLPEDFFDRFSGEHEQLMEILHSIQHDERKMYSVNLPNRGAVPNLPWDALLELPAVATARGISPIQVPDFPDTLAGLLMKHIAIGEITVEAALKGDPKLFVEAVMMGGYMADRKAATAMVDELIEAQKQYLPQFA